MKKYKHNFPKDVTVICKEPITGDMMRIVLGAIDNSNVELIEETAYKGLLDFPLSFFPLLGYCHRYRLISGFSCIDKSETSVSFEEFLAYIKGEGGKTELTLSKQIKIKEKELAELKEQLAKENMPKDGEPCLVWDLDKDDKTLRYSDGNGLFYMDEEKSGRKEHWLNFVRITFHPDDVHKLND